MLVQNRIHYKMRFCRSVTIGAVDIVEAQKHTSVRCWFKGTVPLPLRPTEAVDMVETQRVYHARTYTGSKDSAFFSRDPFFLPIHDNGSCRLGRSAVT